MVRRLLARPRPLPARRRGSTASTAWRRPSPRSRAPTATTSRSPGASRAPTATSIARARYKAEGAPFGGELTVSRPDLGPVADPGVFIGGDRVGDFAVAMVQGDAGRARADRGGLRPPAGRAVHRVLADLQAQDAARAALAPGPRAVGRADLPRATSTASRSGRRPERHAGARDAADDRPAHVAGRGRRPRRARPRAAASGRCGSTPRRRRCGSRVSGKRVAGAGAEDPRHARPTAAAPGSITSRSTTATARRRRASRSTAPPLPARDASRCKVAAVDKAGNVTRKEVSLRIKKS